MSPNPKMTQGSGGGGNDAAPAPEEYPPDSTTEFISQDITADCTLGGDEFAVVEATIETSRYNNADLLDAKLVSVRDAEPDIFQQVTLDIKGRRVFTGTVYEASLTDEHQWKIKAMDAALKLKNKKQSLSAQEPTKVSTLIKSLLDSADIEEYEINIPNSTRITTSKKTTTTQEEKQDKQNIENSKSTQYYTSYSGLSAVSHPGGSGNSTADDSGSDEQGPSDNVITLDNAKAPTASLLNKLTKRANVIWWVDRFNVVRVGKPASKYIGVNWVLEADTGMTTPPYRGVVVSTGPVASEQGRDASGMMQLNGDVVRRGLKYTKKEVGGKATGKLKLTTTATMVVRKGTKFKTDDGLTFETLERREAIIEYDGDGPNSTDDRKTKTVEVPIRAVKVGKKYNVAAGTITTNVDGPQQIEKVTNPRKLTGGADTQEWKKPGWHIVNGETFEPVFYVKDKQITTKKEAKAVANGIIGQFQSYVQGGKVKLVGNEFIDKLDAIRLPDVMGGDKYMAEKVTHELGSSDGFITKVKTGGLIAGHYKHVPGVGNYGGDIQM